MLPVVQADDESMSGGDESDDTDLTDGSSHGSDVPEWNTMPFSCSFPVYPFPFFSFLFVSLLPPAPQLCHKRVLTQVSN
jgi:hypothetical protein